MPSIVLGMKDIAVNKTDKRVHLHVACVCVGGERQRSKIYCIPDDEKSLMKN